MVNKPTVKSDDAIRLLKEVSDGRKAARRLGIARKRNKELEAKKQEEFKEKLGKALRTITSYQKESQSQYKKLEEAKTKILQLENELRRYRKAREDMLRGYLSKGAFVESLMEWANEG